MTDSEHSSSEGTPESSTPTRGEDSSDSKSVIQQALEILRPHTADVASAQQALEATFSKDLQDAATWADKALIWLACAHEIDLEQKAMGEAMQLSLSEAEAEKAQQIPVQQLDTEQLQKRYHQSRISNRLQAEMPTVISELWKPPILQHFAQLLELELKATKWYPSFGTYSYLTQLGTQLAAKLLAASHQIDFSVLSDSMTAAAVDLLHTEVHGLETILYAMPETSGAAPKEFVELDVPAEDMCVTEIPKNGRHMECVELL